NDGLRSEGRGSFGDPPPNCPGSCTRTGSQGPHTGSQGQGARRRLRARKAMIINIKSTGQKQADPDPGQKYVLKSMDRKSRTPFAIGLLLASFVLYLKSFLSSSPSDVQAAEESKVREGDAPPGKTEVTAEI